MEEWAICFLFQGPRRGRGCRTPYHFYCWDLLSSAPVDTEKVWILLLESNKWRLLLHICLTSKARMSQKRHSQKCALIRALAISMLMLSERVKACLSNQRFQESDALQPDWRLVLVHQATPKLPKINLGSFMRLLILSSVLSISALIRKASAPTPRWRPSRLKLLW